MLSGGVNPTTIIALYITNLLCLLWVLCTFNHISAGLQIHSENFASFLGEGVAKRILYVTM